MNLQQLTCTPQQSKELLVLGIDTKAFFWHRLTESANPPGHPLHQPAKWEVAQFKSPAVSDKMLPAWTKEELDLMIGNNWPKPDIYPARMVSKCTDPLSYPVTFPQVMKEYKRGAEASAAVLIYLLEKEEIDPVKAVENYNKVFQP